MKSWFDNGLYEVSIKSEIKPSKQIKKDIRILKVKTWRWCYYCLAALSNDPLGELNSGLTNQINFLIKKFLIWQKVGVKEFIFLQTMYGISKSSNELDEYDKKNPQLNTLKQNGMLKNI